ncbi:MAG: DUF975 family protein [Oscillospiraceae bacterium]|nr:DUF975 family protein [Oscillospiraceae bacterium]
MWNRRELKENAKISLNANYWRSVAAGLVAVIAAGGTARLNLNQSATDEDILNVLSTESDPLAVISYLFGYLSVLMFFSVLGSLLKIFLLNPLAVGCDKFFINSRETGGEELSHLKWSFATDYNKIVLSVFLRDLFIGLWSLLFIIPGIIKSYEYRMVSYILADQPELTRKEAFELSRKMMNGNKWNAFVLDLSFIGWGFLTAITFGILGIFYVNPYIQHTNAALYLKLKEVNCF